MVNAKTCILEKFEVHILGCGAALPTPHHFCSMQVVNVREKLFMIDCAEGAQMQLRKGHLKFSHINNIFLTHLHGDHCFGLIGLISTFALLGRTATLHVYGPVDLKATFQPQLDYFCNGMDYDVELHEIDTKQRNIIYDDRSVTVETIPLKHKIKCCGYLFREKPLLPHIKRDAIDAFNIPISQINNIKCGMDWTTPDGEVIPNHLLTTPAEPARSFAYCSDTMFKPDNAEQLKGVDLLYHEATFAESHKVTAKKTFHSTATEAAEMAKLAEAKQLLIGHLSARYTDENILLNEAKTVFPNTTLANEGMCISI